MKSEKRLQVGNPALIQVSQVKSEDPGHDQVDDNKNVSHRRSKISRQLAADNVDNRSHHDTPPLVIVLNTSSNLPASRRNDCTGHWCLPIALETASKASDSLMIPLDASSDIKIIFPPG